jgi:hypothetical protein
LASDFVGIQVWIVFSHQANAFAGSTTGVAK